MKVGFMGLGIMGQAMSVNIARKGYPLTVYNRTPREVPDLGRLGAATAASARECAEASDVIILMLTGPEACDAVLFGPQGAGGAALRGKTVINMSTVSQSYTASLSEKLTALGCAFLDAPVSGSKKPAQDGSLVILAGGEAEVIERCEPLLLTMGWKIVHCGPVGAGTMMKLAANQLLAIMMEGLAEAVAFGQRGGLDPETILDVILSGPMSCLFFQLKKDILVRDDPMVQFPLKHMVKDLSFALERADADGESAPGLRAARAAFARALEEGLGEEDFASVRKVL